MKRYSFYTILFLCLAIFIIDLLAFYWLQSITQPVLLPFVNNVIYFLFWFFTIGLITAIIVLKLRLDKIHPQRKQIIVSSLYGLTISSFIPKVIFIIVISILYFTNFAFSENESFIVVPIIGVFSGFLPFFVIIHGIFRSLYRFKINHIKVQSKDLPPIFNGLKIIQISDLHLGSFNFRYHILDRAISLINHINPDIIFFTGDIVNNFAWELKGWDTILKKLDANIGKYAVLGNHDYGDYSKWKNDAAKQSNFESIKYFYKKIDFNLLLNESVFIERNGDKIAIAGVENWGNPPFKQYGDLQKSIEKVDPNIFKILLSHDPTHWNEEVIQKTNIALTLSGHTHGMQAGINLKNKKWSPIKYKYQHWEGLHKYEDQYLYVNTGLGWLGFPGRLGMRPEITHITLENGLV